VNKVYQVMAKPLNSHWVVVKRILRYFKGTLFHGLHFQPATLVEPLSLKAFFDVDRAAIFPVPNLTSW